MNDYIFKLSDATLKDKIKLRKSECTDALLGQIISNKIVGIACNNLKLSNLQNETRNALKVLYENDVRKNEVLNRELVYLSSILKFVDFKYAVLKGSVLSNQLYLAGQRTSNDIDILICHDDVSKLQKILLDNGFCQGHINSNKFVPATRKEIIESKLNYGETVPFIKEFDDTFLQIDINFSVDFKPNFENDVVEILLEDIEEYKIHDINLKTLSKVDFLIHLCCHLYKEATTYYWVNTRRDLMLYKFSDINMVINRYGNKKFYDDLVFRIKLLGVEKECYYTLENTSIIYPNMNSGDYISLKNRIKPKNTSFLKEVYDPLNKIVYEYNMSFKEWFFCKNRIKALNKKF